MAKAHITTKDGMTINLEGTAAEIAALVEKFALMGNAPSRSAAAEVHHPGRAAASAKPVAVKRAGGKGRKGGAQGVITDMIGDGYFNKPKSVGEARAELEQAAHYYTRTAVSNALIRAVKAKALRRIKQGGQWAYVV